MQANTINTKRHGWLSLRNVTVDELTKLMTENGVQHTLMNLCQRGEVYKKGKLLLTF